MIDWTLILGILREAASGRRLIVWAVTLISCATGAFFGMVHLVAGADYKGPTIVKKASFGFSETFINMDQITGMPMLAARIQYPLSIRALQRAGVIETDEQMASKAAQRLEVELANAKREMDAALRKSEEAFKASLERMSPKPDVDKHLVVENFFWESGEMGLREIVGTVRSTSDAQYSYVQVSFNLYDSAGSLVGNTVANVQHLEPKGRWKFRAAVFEPSATTAKLKEISSY